MHRYNHPKKNPGWLPSWYLKAFENNAAFHPLKTISRLIGLFVLLSIFLFNKDMYVALVAFAACILFMDAVFFVRKEKESAYKSEAFFQMAQTTPGKMDTYQLWIFGIRSIAFFIFIPLGKFEFYVLTSILSSFVVAPITGFAKLKITQGHKQSLFDKPTERSLTPPGFDHHARTSPSNLASPVFGSCGALPR